MTAPKQSTGFHERLPCHPCRSDALQKGNITRIRLVKSFTWPDYMKDAKATSEATQSPTGAGAQVFRTCDCTPAKPLPNIIITGANRERYLRIVETYEIAQTNVKRHLLHAWHSRDPAHYNPKIDHTFERHFASYYRLELENPFWRNWLKKSVIPKKEWRTIRAWSKILDRKRKVRQMKEKRAAAATKADAANAMDVDSNHSTPTKDTIMVDVGNVPAEHEEEDVDMDREEDVDADDDAGDPMDID